VPFDACMEQDGDSAEWDDFDKHLFIFWSVFHAAMSTLYGRRCIQFVSLISSLFAIWIFFTMSTDEVILIRESDVELWKGNSQIGRAHVW
jgi:hypothetical protein